MKKIVRLTESDLARIVKRVISEDGTQNETASFRLFNCLTKNFTNKFVKDPDSALTDGRTNYTRTVKLGNDAKGTEYTQIINAYKKGNQTFITLSTNVKDVPTKTPGVKQPKSTFMNEVAWSTNEKPLMDCTQLKNLILKNSPILLAPAKYFM